MWDGSAMVLAENLAIAAELLNECAAAGIVLERPQVLKDVQDAVGATVGNNDPWTSSSTVAQARSPQTSQKASPTAW